MIYYSATHKGFYISDIHGPRMHMAPLANWQRPLVKIADPDWVGDPKSQNKTAPLIEVPDLSAAHPMIEVENPSCKIPPDSVEISEEVYRALLSEQSAGKVIVPDLNGHPIAQEPIGQTEEQSQHVLRASAQVALDASDITVLRCFEAGISVPTVWSVYRQALRQIINGASGEVTLPTRPNYPEI